MPGISPIEGVISPSDIATSSADNESGSFIIDELQSVDSTPITRSSILRVAQDTWQWLAQLYPLGAWQAHPEDLELADLLAEGRNIRQAAEQAEQINLQAQQKPSSPPCSTAGIIVSLISAVLTTGVIGTLVVRNRSGDSTPAANNTDIQPFAAVEIPVPVAVVAGSSLSSSVASPLWLHPLINTTSEELVARFPGLRLGAVKQRLIAPLVKQICPDGYAGVSQDMLQQQLVLLTRILFPTLTTEELIPLYCPDGCAGEGAEISARFSLLSENVHITIDRSVLPPRILPDGTPYVVDNEGRCRFIRYNQSTKKWEWVREADNAAYSAEQQKWIKRNVSPLSSLPTTARLKYNPVSGIVTIQVPGKSDSEGAFVGGDFFLVRTPAERGITDKISPKKTPSMPDCRPAISSSSGWLSFGKYGWVFDASSARMAPALKILLENTHNCIRHKPERVLRKQSEADGLYRDNKGHSFLLKEYQYFRVEPQFNAVTGEKDPALLDFAGAFIECRDGVMLLKNADDILFALTNTPAGKFSIETSAANYLYMNALESHAQVKHSLAFPGLHRGHDNSLLFVFNDQKYEAREYSAADNTLRIKRVGALHVRAKDIILWPSGDIVLRVRNVPTDTTYEKLPFTYSDEKEHPAVHVEKYLHQQLQKNIDENRVAYTSDSKNLTGAKDFSLPLLWSDTQSGRQYFLYNDHYFPAKLIRAADAAAPPGVNYLRIFAKDEIFGGNKPLATLVVEEKKDRIELKECESYLAEKVNISKRAAALYLKNSRWRHIAGARKMEDAANVVVANGRFYVAPIPEVKQQHSIVQPNAARLKMAAAGLYPARVSEAQLILSSLQNNQLPTPVKKHQQCVAETINMLKYNILPLLDNNLIYDAQCWNIIRMRLANITGINSDEFHSALSVSWRNRLANISGKLKESNVYLISGDNVHLTQAEITAGKCVFISPDEGRIYINTHKINPEDNAQVRLISELFAALGRSSGMARDIVRIRQAGGMYLPLLEALAAMSGALMQGALSAQQLENIRLVSGEYLKNEPAYGVYDETQKMPQMLAFLAESDPALRGHLLLSSDDLLTLLSLDTYHQLAQARNMSSPADAWMKAYSELRLLTIPEADTEQTTGGAATEKPFHFHHLPDRPHQRTVSRKIADGETVEQSEGKVQQPQDALDAARDSSVGSESVEETGSEYESDSDLSSLRESDSEQELDSELDSNRESGSVEGYDADRESGTDNERYSSQESGSENGYDADRESGTDIDSDSSIERESDTDSQRSRDSASPLSGSIELPDNPLHPVVPPAIPANAAAASVLGLAGIGFMAGAGGLPIPALPLAESTTTDKPDLSNAATTDVPASRNIVITQPSASRGAATTDGYASGNIAITRVSASRNAPTTRSSAMPDTSTSATYVHRGNKLFRSPQDEDKNRRGLPGPDSHDNVFRSGMDYRHAAKEEMVLIPGNENITSIVVPGLECLGDKDVTFTEVMRETGKTLQKPVTENFKAWQEIYHIDIKGIDCPPLESVERLEQITTAFDALINTVISFTPQLMPVAVLQNVVGPALEMAADDLEGKERQAPASMQLLQNIIGFMRKELATLTGQEVVTPVRQKNKGTAVQPPVETTPYAKRFKYSKNGRVYAPVEGQEYPIGTTYDETPLVQNLAGNDRLIRYNQRKELWEFAHSTGKSRYNEERTNQNLYKMSLNQLPENTAITADSYDRVTITNTQETIGVFMGMDFIPVRSIPIKNKIWVYAHKYFYTNEEVPFRLLVRDEYGWQFEQDSVNLDKYVKLLLESKNERYESDKILHGPIGSDGLSYDSWDNAYIKKDYRYYKVNKKSEGMVALTDYDDATIKFTGNHFSLINPGYDFFTGRNIYIQDKEKPFFLEENTPQFLHEGHVVYDRTNDAMSRWVGPGLYTDLAGTRIILAANGKYYRVTHHSEREMHVQSFDERGVFIFWLDNNNWLRIRDKPTKNNIEYTDLVSCRSVRSPGGANCRGVRMDKELQRLLAHQIHLEMTSDRVPPERKLRRYMENKIHNLFKDSDTDQLFFRNMGKYFNAELLDEHVHPKNPTDFPCLRITGRSDFFSFEKEIAIIVMKKNNDIIEVQELTTFIAEKLNVTPGEASAYLAKRFYNDMPDINLLEKKVLHQQLSNNVYVPWPRLRQPTEGISGIELRRIARSFLFPEHIVRSRDYRIEIYDIEAETVQYNLYTQEAIRAISRKLSYITDVMLPGVIHSLNPQNHDHPIVESYLIEVFGKDTPEFLHDAEKSLGMRLDIVQEQLRNRRVKVMVVTETFGGRSAKYDKGKGKLVFIHPEDNDTIFINGDMIAIGNNAEFMSIKELTGAVISEVIHAAVDRSFGFGLPRNEGIFINIHNSWEYVKEKIRYHSLYTNIRSGLHSSIADYLDHSPIYKTADGNFIDVGKDWKIFNFLLTHDPGFRAQMALDSEDIVTLMTQDLHYLVATSEQDMAMLHPWVRRYGERRGVIYAMEDRPGSTNIVCSVDITLMQVKEVSPQVTVQGSVSGKKNIYLTTGGGLLFSNMGGNYRAEFLGKSGRILVLGKEDETRLVYYYDPVNGDVTPVLNKYDSLRHITYYKEVDLYETKIPGYDFSEVLKYDAQKELLVPTGATRIVRLPAHIIRLEYPSFNLYLSRQSYSEVYILGHGKALPTKSTLPEDAYASFYTLNGQQIFPYQGSADDFLSGKFRAREVILSRQEINDYMIKPFSSDSVNAYHLARLYKKNIVQLLSSPARSKILIESVTKLLQPGEVDFHFYTCRTTREQSLFSGSADNLDPPIEGEHAHFGLYTSSVLSARWIFDQQIAGGAVTENRKLTEFMPYRERNSFLRDKTIDLALNECLKVDIPNHTVRKFYGLDISGYAREHIPKYIIDARISMLKSLKKAREIIDMALENLKDNNLKKTIDDYLCYALNIDEKDQHIVARVKARLRGNALRVSEYLDESQEKNYNNIVIVSTAHIPDPANPERFISPLTREQQAHLLSAFVLPGDAYRRVFMMNDANFFIQVPASGKMVNTKDLKQYSVILHEMSHINAETLDIAYIDYNREDFTESGYNVMDSRVLFDAVNEQLETKNIRTTTIWKEFMPLVKKHYGIERELEADEFLQMIKDDKMLKINLNLVNAESFAIYITHIANLGWQRRRKREVDNMNVITDADYKYQALLFTATQDHLTHDIE